MVHQLGLSGMQHALITFPFAPYAGAREGGIEADCIKSASKCLGPKSDTKGMQWGKESASTSFFPFERRKSPFHCVVGYIPAQLRMLCYKQKSKSSWQNARTEQLNKQFWLKPNQKPK